MGEVHTLLEIALREYGVQEIVGGEHNAVIVEYFKESGHGWVHDDELAWCSSFMNAMARRAGLESTGKLNARSWLDVGVHITNPQPGDLVIFWRKGKSSAYGHIAIFINFDEDGRNINVLGGNQGNMVRISGYDKGRLLGFRRLASV